jgi:hypothetical protein
MSYQAGRGGMGSDRHRVSGLVMHPRSPRFKFMQTLPIIATDRRCRVSGYPTQQAVRRLHSRGDISWGSMDSRHARARGMPVAIRRKPMSEAWTGVAQRKAGDVPLDTRQPGAGVAPGPRDKVDLAG